MPFSIDLNRPPVGSTNKTVLKGRQKRPCQDLRAGGMSMSGEKIRCHPTVIVEKTLGAFPSVVVVLILLVAWIDSSAILSMLVLALVALLLFYYRQWKRTTIQFNDTDVVIDRDTLFQMKKTLPM